MIKVIYHACNSLQLTISDLLFKEIPAESDNNDGTSSVSDYDTSSNSDHDVDSSEQSSMDEPWER